MTRVLAVVLLALVAGCSAPDAEDLPPPPSNPSAALSSSTPIENGAKSFTITSITSGLSWGHIELRVNDTALSFIEGPCTHPTAGQWSRCRHSEPLPRAEPAAAGDRFVVGAPLGSLVSMWANGTRMVSISISS